MKKEILLITLVLFTLNLNGQGCLSPTAQLDLNTNQVRARILTGGDLWCDFSAQTAQYEVPVGSGKNSLYAGSIWIGGFDQFNNLLVAAQTYRQSGSNDYWPGPISKDLLNGTLSISPSTCSTYDNIFSISRQEVIDFINGGIPSSNITNWPGNGSFANGELPFLAPFFDANNDGIYNTNDGDYPYFNLSNTYTTSPISGETVCDGYLFGDNSLWWVFNDIGNVKTETNSAPIGLEIRAQAYSYNASAPLDVTTFYNYQIINRSSNDLDSAYIGFWVDGDLGNAVDDYIGCDAFRDLGYFYNADADDDGSSGYGTLPPAIGIDLLRGPIADPNDGIDNDHDFITDEPGERTGMNTFQYYNNVNNTPTGNPITIDDYYEYLSGSWLDGLPVTYGGDGRGTGPGATTTPTTLMFPDNSNPSFSTPWNMANSGIVPNDMRFLLASGKFTLQPGEVQYITYAAIWQRSTQITNMPSVNELKLASDFIQSFFENCFSTVGINEIDQLNNIVVAPNPFTDHVTINFEKSTIKEAQIKVYNLQGKIVYQSNYDGKQKSLTIGDEFISGVYIVNIEKGNDKISKKIVKF